MRAGNSRWTAVAVAGCISLSLLSSVADVGAAQAGSTRAPTEVIFIGANHNLAFLHPGFSPAHIRALLSKIAPAAICVELTPDWPRHEGIPTFPQEQYAVLTWAERANVPVFAVDSTGADVRARPPVVRMSDTAALRDQGERFRGFAESYVATVRWTAERAFAEANGDLESFQRTTNPLTVDRWPEEDPGAAARDDRIANNIRAVFARYPGKRVVVAYGSYHYLPLKRRLETGGDLRLVPPTRYFPLEAERVHAGWHPDDAVVLLGTNLDDWRSIAFPQSRNHQRTRELLDRLHEERPGSTISRYYNARWRMLFGDFAAAVPLLRQIVQENGTTSTPYLADTRWKWPPLRTVEQQARFYLAVAHDLTGDHAAAGVEYRALLNLSEDQLVVPSMIWARRIDLRPYLESLIRIPYRGGIFEAYRASLAMGR